MEFALESNLDFLLQIKEQLEEKEYQMQVGLRQRVFSYLSEENHLINLRFNKDLAVMYHMINKQSQYQKLLSEEIHEDQQEMGIAIIKSKQLTV